MRTRTPTPADFWDSDDKTEAQPSDCFACKRCTTGIAWPESLVSTAFRGHAGRGALFSDVSNTSPYPPSVLLMNSGAYDVEPLACASCGTYIGWKFLSASEEEERWKEGKVLLELERIMQPLGSIEERDEGDVEGSRDAGTRPGEITTTDNNAHAKNMIMWHRESHSEQAEIHSVDSSGGSLAEKQEIWRQDRELCATPPLQEEHPIHRRLMSGSRSARSSFDSLRARPGGPRKPVSERGSISGMSR